MTTEDPRISEVLSRCERSHPGLDVSRAEFARWIVERGPKDRELSHWLEECHAEDLYLAHACWLPLPGALAFFESDFVPGLRSALRRIRFDNTLVEDALQLLRTRLFVAGRDGTKGIAKYSGRGPLRLWLRVSGTRALQELTDRERGAARTPSSEDATVLLGLPSPDDSPEVQYLKRAHGPQFKQAFSEALRALPDRLRLVISQYYVDGLTLQQLGALHGVHLVTVARWLVKARQTVLEGARDRMKLPLDGLSDPDSLLRLLRSQLSSSLLRNLASPAQDS